MVAPRGFSVDTELVRMMMKKSIATAMLTVALVGTSDWTEIPSRVGAAQGGPTTGEEMQAPFDPSYLVGVWEVEWNPPEMGLFPPGMYTGTETVTHINSRYLKVTLNLQSEDGATITGTGMIFYEYGLSGQSMLRYVVYDAGFELLKQGPVGGDLGGYYSAFWETPQFNYNDQKFSLRGRSFFVSPGAYRVNQEVSVNGTEFANFGVMWLTKKSEGSGQ